VRPSAPAVAIGRSVPSLLSVRIYSIVAISHRTVEPRFEGRDVPGASDRSGRTKLTLAVPFRPRSTRILPRNSPKTHSLGRITPTNGVARAPKTSALPGLSASGRCKARTCDFLLVRQALYQLS
jgi:hypothetical protein